MGGPDAGYAACMVNIDDGQTGETLVITGGTNKKIKMVREQAQLGAPHSEIQVELD